MVQGHVEPSVGNRNVQYFDQNDGFKGACICQNVSQCTF